MRGGGGVGIEGRGSWGAKCRVRVQAQRVCQQGWAQTDLQLP